MAGEPPFTQPPRDDPFAPLAPRPPDDSLPSQPSGDEPVASQLSMEPVLPPVGPLGAPAEPSPASRPGWSDGTFFIVLVLLLIAFTAGIFVDRSGIFESAPSTGGAGSASSSPSVAVGTIGPGVTVPPDMPADFGLFWQSIDLIRQHYVDQSAVTSQAITYGAISGVVDELGDPGHTVFLTPDDVKSEQQALEGTIVGIGVYLGEPAGGGLVIQSVIDGSPADKAGLHALDRIIDVNGQNVENLSTANVAALIRGPEGTTVEITIVPNGTSSPRTVTITRAKITVPAVAWALVPGTHSASVQISQFSQGTTDQLKSALRDAAAAGATSIVLDLRENPGGLVDEAVGVASQFLDSGFVYIRQDANGNQTKVPVKGGGVATTTPLTVLVDYGTASAAEIVAGALQDAGRGKVIGVRTFGTGTVLNTFSLADGSALRLAVEEWLTPDGRRIFPDGITPDTTVELAAGEHAVAPQEVANMTAAEVAASGDAQLLAGLQQLGATP